MYAQSNVQLFSQLMEEGYSERELGYVLDTYELAVHLFTGRFQPSGNTFLSHVVRTASILTSLHAPAEVVSAGLIHSVYRQGEFGDGREKISNYKRRFVRGAVGEKVEDYVYRFKTLNWNLKTIPDIRDLIRTDGKIDHNVIIMKLANELEHLLDFEILYYGKVQKQRVLQHGNVMLEMADALGYPNLVSQFEKVIARAMSNQVPAAIRRITAQNRPFEIIRTIGENESVIVFPRGSRRKMVARFFQLYRRAHAFIKRRFPLLDDLCRKLRSPFCDGTRKDR